MLHTNKQKKKSGITCHAYTSTTNLLYYYPTTSFMMMVFCWCFGPWVWGKCKYYYVMELFFLEGCPARLIFWWESNVLKRDSLPHGTCRGDKKWREWRRRGGVWHEWIWRDGWMVVRRLFYLLTLGTRINTEVFWHFMEGICMYGVDVCGDWLPLHEKRCIKASCLRTRLWHGVSVSFPGEWYLSLFFDFNASM